MFPTLSDDVDIEVGVDLIVDSAKRHGPLTRCWTLTTARRRDAKSSPLDAEDSTSS